MIHQDKKEDNYLSPLSSANMTTYILYN